MERDLKADPGTEAAILEHLHQQTMLNSTGNVEQLLALFHPEIMSFGTGADENTFSVEELRKGLERDLSQVEHLWDEWSWTRVWCRGDIAWLAAEGTAFWIADGRRQSMPARLTQVYQWREDRWLCVHNHFSAPAAGQPEGHSWPTPIEAVASAVSKERPDLSAQTAPDGTITILFTDIENSTGLTERLSDIHWLELLRRHNSIVREQVAEHGCFEVKSQGDGFMIASQSARRAAHCAIAVQRELAKRHEGWEEPIRVRMGLHTGEVLKDADDFFGRHVILASRVAGKARGGEILASRLFKELTESGGDLRFGPARETELKGLSGTHEVFEVLWEGS